MSNPAFRWLNYVQWMCRLYPARLKLLDELRTASHVAHYGASSSAGGRIRRPTERLGTVSLGETVDKEMEAVRKAIEATRNLPDGDLILRLIDLQFWSCTHSQAGAALALGISESTAKRRQSRFFFEVGRAFGLTEYTQEAKRLRPVKRSLLRS